MGACGVLGHVVRRLAKRVVDVRVDEAVDALVDVDHARPLPCDFIGLHQRGVRVPHLVVPHTPMRRRYERLARRQQKLKPQLDALARTQRARAREGAHGTVGTDDRAAVAAIVPPVRNVGSRHQVLRRLEAGCAARQPQPHPRRRVAEPDEVVAQPLLPPPANGRAPLEEAARLAKSHHVTCARRHERQEQLDVVEGDIARRTQREL